MARGVTQAKKGGRDNALEEPVSQIDNEVESVANVIDGPEIQALSINYEELESIRSSFVQNNQMMNDEANKKSKKIMVRREQLDFVDHKLKSKYLVTKKGNSEPEREVQKHAPITFEKTISENRIIGSLDQFVKSAIAAGDLDENHSIVQRMIERERASSSLTNGSFQFDSYKPVSDATKQHSTRNETNALQNWREKMIERKRHQGYISKLLNKNPAELVSSGTDEYRARQEAREIIDRALPSIDYGKGYRVGSEFWRQYESVGDDLGGLKMSLKVSERGKPDHVTRIGKPDLIREEFGEKFDNGQNSRKPVKTRENDFMKKRCNELSGVFTEFDSHLPDYSNLIVLGNQNSSDDLEESTTDSSPRCNEELIESEQSVCSMTDYNGPAIQLQNKIMTYEDGIDKVIETFFYSDKFRGKMSIDQIRLHNIGRTTLYYNWEKTHRNKSYSAQRNDQTQRFFFNASPGSILPGEAKSIPLVFESPNAGKFTEIWKLSFKPALGVFQVVLKGNSQSLEPEDDENKLKREEIENLLEREEAQSAARYVMNKVLHEVKTPPRSPSPDHLYQTEEGEFENANPGYFYDYVNVNQLVEMWKRHWPEESMQLDFGSIRRKLFELEDWEIIEQEQKTLNEVSNLLKRKPLQLYSLTPYDHVRKQLGDTIEHVTDEMIQMRRKMHITQTTPFPLDYNRPTSSQMSMTSVKGGAKDDKALKKTNSATKKQKSAGKGGPEKKDDKKKKKSKTDVKPKGKESKAEEDRTSSTQLSNYSDGDSGTNLNDPENAALRENYMIKMKSITKEILISSFDQIAALLSND